ncbi:retrovirus-related pol polyprotein from transposon TNT 1-94 [Tanacetum coccineum]
MSELSLGLKHLHLEEIILLNKDKTHLNLEETDVSLSVDPSCFLSEDAGAHIHRIFLEDTRIELSEQYSYISISSFNAQNAITQREIDESPPPTKLSPLVDDDVGEEDSIKNNVKVANNNNVEDESLEVEKVVNIKESKDHPLEQVIKPKNINEALGDESWVVAMQEELNQFIANDVWDLVSLPKNHTVIGTK